MDAIRRTQQQARSGRGEGPPRSGPAPAKIERDKREARLAKADSGALVGGRVFREDRANSESRTSSAAIRCQYDTIDGAGS
jgi:hypothetical protein